jgi:hypothetical protein
MTVAKLRAEEESAAKEADGKAHVPGLQPHISVADRMKIGQDRRRTVPLDTLSAWKPPKDRRDPIDILIAQDKNRMQDLVPIRYGRMLEIPFAFYRGAAAVMASDLAYGPTKCH